MTNPQIGKKSIKKVMEQSQHEITIDFLELSHMREFIKQYAIEKNWKKGIRKNAYWEDSGFYIGRGVQRFYFHNICAKFSSELVRLAAELAKKFGDGGYRFYVADGMSIVVHLRNSLQKDDTAVEIKPLKVVD